MFPTLQAGMEDFVGELSSPDRLRGSRSGGIRIAQMLPCLSTGQSASICRTDGSGSAAQRGAARYEALHCRVPWPSRCTQGIAPQCSRLTPPSLDRPAISTTGLRASNERRLCATSMAATTSPGNVAWERHGAGKEVRTRRSLCAAPMNSDGATSAWANPSNSQENAS